MSTVHQIDFLPTRVPGGTIVQLSFGGSGIQVAFVLNEETVSLAARLRNIADQLDPPEHGPGFTEEEAQRFESVMGATAEQPIVSGLPHVGRFRQAVDEATADLTPGTIPVLQPRKERLVETTSAPTAPTKAQLKAGLAFMIASLRMAQANCRDGFDARMLDSAIVIGQAQERAL